MPLARTAPGPAQDERIYLRGRHCVNARLEPPGVNAGVRHPIWSHRNRLMWAFETKVQERARQPDQMRSLASPFLMSPFLIWRPAF